MNFSEQIKKHDLFHAYIIESTDSIIPDLKTFIENDLGILVDTNPDVLIKVYDSFGIADSREITRFAQMRPLGEIKCIVWSTAIITEEAQDALLKIFEEPPERTHFFLIVQSKDILRPTLLSRVRTISIREKDDTNTEAENFLNMNYDSRIKYVAKIAKDKDKAAAISLLNDLENELSKKDIKKKAVRDAVGVVLLSKKYINDKGAMLKMLLENVAIQLPIIK